MAAELRLRVGLKNGRSTITDRYFTSPLKLGMPAGRGDRLEIMMMMASAGLLKGDVLDYEIQCEPETKTRLTEQSYTKIFDTGDGSAQKRKHIRLQGNASLYDCPSAVIPFQNSTFDSETLVELDTDSEFAWSDILAAGRIAMNEKFAFRHYRNRVCVKVEGILVWLDHCLLEPEWMDVNGMLFFDGYTHQGTFYYYGSKTKTEQILSWRENLNVEWNPKKTVVGVTAAAQGICVRVLSNSAQDIEEVFTDLAEMLGLENNT